MSIRPVLDFLNSVDLRTYGSSRGLLERDELANPVRTQRWLTGQGIFAPTAGLPNETETMRQIREQLRSALVGDQTLRLEASLALTIEQGAPPRLAATEQSPVTDAIAALIVTAAASPGWFRLRVCAAEDCRWAFYDTSRSGRSRWCSMRACGNRMKSRSYRRRTRIMSAPTAAPMTRVARRPRTNTLRREGDYWTIASSGRLFRLRDSKGLRHLSRLVAEPHREFHVLDLAGGGRFAGGVVPEVTASYVLLDDDARASYEARLRALEADTESADSAHASRAQDEMEFIARELQRATGIAGRDRLFTTDSERARISVTRVIKAALARIGDESPELKHHFASTVRTGTYCSYNPDPRLPVRWEL